MKNSIFFRLMSAFFFLGLCASTVLFAGVLVFLNFPDAGIWFAELLR
ncbi:MAG: hypothetical protein LBC87_09920 [Fibromonadaceae bacterium]|nr:hypothetical protein [Fibromonadaceae bacterium]